MTMRVATTADTLAEGDWIDLDRLDGRGTVPLLIATLTPRLADLTLGTPERVEVHFAGDPDTKVTLFPPAHEVIRYTEAP